MTTTWRYCIARDRLPDGSDRYSIREVYTDDKGALSWSADPTAPHGETWVEVAEDLMRMTSAMGGDMLDLTLDPPAYVKPRRSAAPRVRRS